MPFKVTEVCCRLSFCKQCRSKYCTADCNVSVLFPDNVSCSLFELNSQKLAGSEEEEKLIQAVKDSDIPFISINDNSENFQTIKINNQLIGIVRGEDTDVAEFRFWRTADGDMGCTHKDQIEMDFIKGGDPEMTYKVFREIQTAKDSKEAEDQASTIVVLIKKLTDFFEAKKAFLIFPEDDSLKGTVGYLVFRNEGENEESVDISFKVAAEARLVNHEKKESFEKAFAEAWNSRHPIKVHDDPMSRVFGFIVETRDERVWHCISLTHYKG